MEARPGDRAEGRSGGRPDGRGRAATRAPPGSRRLSRRRGPARMAPP